MYFYLNDHCFFVKGACNGAIYDLKNNELYEIEHKESEFLEKSEYGEPIDNMDINFYKDIQEADLGAFYEKKVFIEKIRPYSQFLFKLNVVPIPPRMAYIKLNNSCEAGCINCGKNFCPTCLCTTNNYDKELPYEKWIEVINYLYDAGLKEIVFTGGDALNYADLSKLIEFSISKGLKVHLIINTPGGGINSNGMGIEKLPEEINIIMNWYKDDYNIEESLNKVSRFKHIAISYMNEVLYDKMLPYKKDNMSFLKASIDKKISSEDCLIKFDMSKYFIRKDLDSCLYGKVYFDFQGNIVPCYESIDNVIGNINDEPIDEVLKDLIGNYWFKPFTSEKCSNCEYYYTCPSCKFLDVKNNCTYKELKGSW